jgi:hypothetical protein
MLKNFMLPALIFVFVSAVSEVDAQQWSAQSGSSMYRLHKNAKGPEPCSTYCHRKWGFSPYLVSRCFYTMGHCDHSR